MTWKLQLISIDADEYSNDIDIIESYDLHSGCFSYKKQRDTYLVPWHRIAFVKLIELTPAD